MGAFRVFKCMIAFLTRIPVGMDPDCIQQAARHMYLFPIVGAFIGLLGGAVALVTHLLHLGPIVGILTLGSLLLITGLHHTDGLLDFGDGLMALGTAEERIRAMRDTTVGTGGVVMGFVVLSATAVAISELSFDVLLAAIVVSESCAKLGMVIGAKFGKSANSGGMAASFLDSMRGRSGWLKSLVALATCILIAMVWRLPIYFAGIVTATITGIAIAGVSNSNFGALTGDGLGAINDVARMASLVVMVGVMQWI